MVVETEIGSTLSYFAVAVENQQTLENLSGSLMLHLLKSLEEGLDGINLAKGDGCSVQVEGH